MLQLLVRRELPIGEPLSGSFYGRKGRRDSVNEVVLLPFCWGKKGEEMETKNAGSCVLRGWEVREDCVDTFCRWYIRQDLERKSWGEWESEMRRRCSDKSPLTFWFTDASPPILLSLFPRTNDYPHRIHSLEPESPEKETAEGESNSLVLFLPIKRIDREEEWKEWRLEARFGSKAGCFRKILLSHNAFCVLSHTQVHRHSDTDTQRHTGHAYVVWLVRSFPKKNAAGRNKLFC